MRFSGAHLATCTAAPLANVMRVPVAYLTVLVVACIALAGCAAQSSFQQGSALASAGKSAEAMAKFEEAVGMDSTNARYRLALIQTRERLVNEAIAAANRAVEANDPDTARKAFDAALALQANEPRSVDGLRALESAKRVGKWLGNAEAARDKKDDRNVLMWSRMVLAEDPKNAGALAIAQALEEHSEPALVNSVLADAYRKTITIEFKDAPLKTVFEVISRTSGLNFLFDKDVKTDQKTSIFLKNSSIESAINLTLLTNQLEQRVLDGNSVLIYPNTQAKQKDYQPLTVRSFYLSNGEAKNVANTLKTILKSRDVVVDDKLNMIIMRDSPEAVRMAEKLVALHDVQEPEVMLEVEILEVKRGRLLDLGIRWPEQVSLTPLPTGTGGLTLGDLRRIKSDTVGVGLGPTTVNAKNVDTDANILANPRIRVRNREKAKILIGERVPNISSTATSTGFVSESVTYVDVGLKLDVEPTIYPDGEVAIKVALEVSNVVNQVQTKSGSLAYQIGTRTAQTVLRLKDNENQVLAGLINDEDRRSANKIPFLGDIPIAGRLFGSQANDNSKTEIVLSITPRILRNVQRPGAAIMEFESGTESSLGSRVPAGAPLSIQPVGGGESGGRQSLVTASPSAAASGPSTNSANAGSTNAGSANTVATGANGGSTATGSVVGSSQLRWQGSTQLKVGDNLALQLLMQSDQPVVSLPMAVGFDAKTLQVVSITEGDFLKQNGGQTSFSSRVDPNGQILMTGTRAGDSGATVLGSVATVNFRVVSATSAETRVQLLTISPVALGGRGVNTALPAAHVISIAP
jgi:general secretion pathway protein D